MTPENVIPREITSPGQSKSIGFKTYNHPDLFLFPSRHRNHRYCLLFLFSALENACSKLFAQIQDSCLFFAFFKFPNVLGRDCHKPFPEDF